MLFKDYEIFNPLLESFEKNHIGHKYERYKYQKECPFKDFNKEFGTFVPKKLNPECGVFKTITCSKDFKVFKLFRINSKENIVSSIRKTLITNFNNYETPILGKQDIMFKNDLFSWINFKAIHSYLPSTFFDNYYKDNLIVSAIIPSNTPFIVGIDEYTQQISVISEKIKLPQIDIVKTEIYNFSKIYKVTQDSGKTFQSVYCYE